MGASNKSQDLMDATMQIVAEVGFSDFSTRLAAKRAGVSDGLMYRFFSSKDDLLYACFESIHKQIAGIFKDTSVTMPTTESELAELVHGMWYQYFKFLVQNGYRTLFYFEYRDSPYLQRILEKDAEVQNTYFAGFVQIVAALDAKYHFASTMGEAYLWTYILDLSGIFARRIIRGKLPDTEESYEKIWKLISGGLLGLMQGEVS